MVQAFRRKIFTAGTLFLLTIFFTVLYLVLAINVERYSLNRIKDATIHSASIINELFSSYALNAEYAASYTYSAYEMNVIALLLKQAGNSRMGQYTAIRIKQDPILLFDTGREVSVQGDGPVRRTWRACMASTEAETRFLGPIPSLTHTGKEFLVVSPVRNAQGQNKGTFALRIPLSELSRKISDMYFPGDMARKVYIITAEGEILSPVGADNIPVNINTVPNLAPMKDALLKASGSVQKIVLDEGTFFLCKTPLQGTDWYAVLLTPTKYELRFLSALRIALSVAWACLAFFIILVFHQSRRFSHYKELSERDHLTSAGNRLAFEKALTQLQDENRYPISLIMLDVDGLKIINDSLGHEAGDTLLRRSAALLQRSLRENDIVYRIGGDEFAAIFPSTGMELAQILADRIVANVITSRKTKSLPPVSISYGLAEAATPQEFSSLYRRADETMYEYKNIHREAARKCIEEWLRENPAPADRRQG